MINEKRRTGKIKNVTPRDWSQENTKVKSKSKKWWKLENTTKHGSQSYCCGYPPTHKHSLRAHTANQKEDRISMVHSPLR